VGETAQPEGSCIMVWSLSPKPVCRALEVVPGEVITSMAYGPYDNGPLMTADNLGLVRVWDCQPDLTCLQIAQAPLPGECTPVVAVDHMREALYSVTGDERLYIWRRADKVVSEPEVCY